MSDIIKNRIDFLGVIGVKNANPNGDPLNSNRPRMDLDGFGEISDVCIKRKIRNRFQELGYDILIKSPEYNLEGKSIKSIVEQDPDMKIALNKKNNSEELKRIACETWIDVRFFGAVIAYKGQKDGVSIPIRGPVSLGMAKSIDTIYMKDFQITKSINSLVDSNVKIKDESTVGRKSVVERGAYVFCGSISPQLAQLTGFTNEDAELLKECLCTLFENDASTARPVGSMWVDRLYWWEHDRKKRIYPPRKIFDTLTFTPQSQSPYYSVEEHPLDGVVPELYI